MLVFALEFLLRFKDKRCRNKDFIDVKSMFYDLAEINEQDFFTEMTSTIQEIDSRSIFIQLSLSL